MHEECQSAEARDSTKQEERLLRTLDTQLQENLTSSILSTVYSQNERSWVYNEERVLVAKCIFNLRMIIFIP